MKDHAGGDDMNPAGGGADAAEVQEWVEAISSVIAFEGADAADHLLTKTVAQARRFGAKVPFAANTAYMNTIAPDRQPEHPGDREIEHRLRSAIRWNAAMLVLRANKESSELGGHIASFQSAATLYDTGFMHFWRGAEDPCGGDLLFIQATARRASTPAPSWKAV